MEGWVNKSWTQRAVWGFLSYSFSSALYLSLYRSLSPLHQTAPEHQSPMPWKSLSLPAGSSYDKHHKKLIGNKQNRGKRAECCVWITKGVNILRARLWRVLCLLEAHIKLMTFATGSECAGHSPGFRGLQKPRFITNISLLHHQMTE